MPPETRHEFTMGRVREALERWRAGIRLGETAIVIGLWGGALATGDPVIAQILFVLGLLVGIVAIVADPNTSRATGIMLICSLILCFLGADAIFLWRHDLASAKAPAAAPPPQIVRQIERYYPAPAPQEVAKPVPPTLAPRDTIIRERPAPEHEPPNPPPPEKPTAGPQTQERLDEVLRRYRREGVGSTAQLQCNVEKWRLGNGLIDLIADAARAQNQYHEYKNAKQIIGDFNKWYPRAKAFLEQNKDKLPNTAIFELASEKAGQGLFPRPGFKAWVLFDAKRQALEAIRAQLDARSCETEGKAAIAECEESGNCQASH
jgi:hypothetical protein